MNQIKYIYWFAYYNEESPSVRYRGKYPLEYFKEKHDVEYSLIIPGYKSKRMWSFIRSYLSALFFRKKDSVIVIQRVHSNFIYSSLLKVLVTVHKRNTVYDLDDADYLYCPPKTIYSFAKKCSAITAGSNAIAEHLSRFNENIIVTSSPTPDLEIVKTNRSTVFTIGWIGGFGGDHKKSLIEYVFPALKDLNFDCKFVLLGIIHPEDCKLILDYFSNCQHLKIELPTDLDWKNESVLQKEIASFDVGIATLLDNEIQRSKSGIKAKQYLNNGVPVLGTNLPENDWVIKDGVNGFFCNTPEDFKKRITEFHAMTEEQFSDFSQNARQSLSDFNHEKYYADFSKVRTPVNA